MDPADELRDNSPIGSRQDEQAVIICLHFPIGKLKNKKASAAIADLGDVLREIIVSSHVGRYGGYEFCESKEEECVTFYLYGKNAHNIYQEVKQVRESLSTLPGFSISKRYIPLSSNHVSSL